MVSALLFSSCANRYDVTFYSQPAGAMITNTSLDGTPQSGEAPFYVYHIITEEDKKRGYWTPKYPVSARWVSGAKVTATNLRFPLKAGRYQSYQFVRPPTAPNALVDAQYGLMKEQTLAIQEQARAARVQAAAAVSQSISASQQAAAARQQATAVQSIANQYRTSYY